MTSKEAIEILRKGYPDISTYPVNEYQNHHEDMALYNEAVDLAVKALETADDPDSTSNGSWESKTMFDDCYPCTNCQEFECDGCMYDLMHKGNQ